MLVLTIGILTVFFLLASTEQQDVPVKFSCQGRAAGYYADVDSGCQIYHMCDGLGRQFSYSCPNTTLFQQRMLICDHWYMVNCSRSETDYAANLLIGQQKPFVEDSDINPYHRTPRPDLLSQTEFDNVYRNGRAQNHADLNLVGINSDYDQNNGSSKVTERPAYHLPSHWSTEYSRDEVTSPTPSILQKIFETQETSISPTLNTRPPNLRQESKESENRHISGFAQSFAQSFTQSSSINSQSQIESFSSSNIKIPVGLAIPIPKADKYNSNNLDKIKNINAFPKKEIAINFKSAFRATTPVFPTKNELGTTEAPVDDILIAPETKNADIMPDTSVNFKSLFKATTPVFPTKEELVTTESSFNGILTAPDSDNQKEDTNSIIENAILINFSSLFKATTPVFPTKEELVTTESPLNDLQPPISDSQYTFSTDASLDSVVPLNFDIQTPSNILQLPKLQYDKAIEENITEQNKYDVKSNKNKSKQVNRLSNEKVLKDLRKMFSIPDYEFPLDSASRPNYDHSLDSFQVNPFLIDIKQREHASDR